MNKITLLIFLTAFGISPLSAQTNSTSARPSANRYLLILETSHTMRGRADGVRIAVQDLLMSSMGGQLQPGDTLGFWTYNDELHAGQFPMQVWAPQTKSAVVARALAFLTKQTYEKQAALEKVLPAMDRLIKSSEFITVILISSGQQPMIGTPFDKQINDLQKRWTPEEQKAHRPFVTVLRAKRGTITGFSVTPAPWPVEFPAFPAETNVAKASLEPAAKPPASVKAQSPAVPPLIISGKKIAEEKAQAATPSANLSAPIDHPLNPSSQPADQNVPAALPPGTRSTSAQPTMPSGNAEAPVRPSQGSAASVGQPAPASGGPSLTTSESAIAPNNTGASQAAIAPGISTQSQTATTALAPASASQQPDSPHSTAASVTEHPPASEAAANSSAPAQNAVAVPPAGVTVLGRGKMWLPGLLLIGVASGLLAIAVHRIRAASRTSLITRSLDRHQKQ